MDLKRKDYNRGKNKRLCETKKGKHGYTKQKLGSTYLLNTLIFFHITPLRAQSNIAERDTVLDFETMAYAVVLSIRGSY